MNTGPLVFHALLNKTYSFRWFRIFFNILVNIKTWRESKLTNFNDSIQKYVVKTPEKIDEISLVAVEKQQCKSDQFKYLSVSWTVSYGWYKLQLFINNVIKHVQEIGKFECTFWNWELLLVVWCHLREPLTSENIQLDHISFL